LRTFFSALTGKNKRYRLLALLAALAIAGSGCKLKVYVPSEDGHVESKSGAFYCSLMSVCSIDVYDTSFEETFRAVPADGFVFAGWRDRPDGLYGNTIGEAHISTAQLAASQPVLDMLASEDVYYLEPRFIEMDAFEWESRGDELLGTRSYPVNNVELSADGEVYATIDESATGISASVYEWAGSRWRKRGEAIGQAAASEAIDIALSRDGTVLAFSSRSTDRSNEVRLFRWTGRAWDSMGDEIRGEYPGDRSGVLSLDHDGTHLAIGAPNNSDGGTDAGHARVFSWNGQGWEQRGNDIDGIPDSMLGSAVDLSANGNFLAVGAPANAARDSTFTGTASVYFWDGSQWILRGEVLQGRDTGDGFGQSLSISASGQHLAVGSTGIYARVFAWEEERWLARGRGIESDRAYIDQVDVDISDSGGIVAVSTPGYGLKASYSEEGRVRVMIWDGSKWLRLGDPVYGDSNCDDGGRCPAGNAGGGRLSADGSVLALADSGTGEELQRGGRIRIFSGTD
jgi:hypothetical protein